MNTAHVTENSNDDILFECPQCGKSLEIDARGAGYMIVCPDCKNEIQVPAWNTLPDGGEDRRERIPLDEKMHRLQVRIASLEKLQQSDAHCLKRIGDELVLIQAALDRITEIVESRKSEG
jgi:acetone carboxylase gamma subunit